MNKARMTSTRNVPADWRFCNASRMSSTQSRSTPKPLVSTVAVAVAVIGAGRKPRRRLADLMIASIAIAEDLPLYTTNPKDFAGLDSSLTIVPVNRRRTSGEDVTESGARQRPAGQP